MKKEDLSQYYDYLLRLAHGKTASDADAEDLVSETVLRALAAMERGVEIEYPKTWLAHTFSHVWNDALRKKYRQPVTTELNDDVLLPSEDPFAHLFERDEAAEVRREVNFLSREIRTIFVLCYWNGMSVAEIARTMGIPEGTVKSRLAGGRQRIRKGLEQNMIQQAGVAKAEHHKIPDTLRLTMNGSVGGVDSPQWIVERDLIVQNILIEAYDRPLEIAEIAARLGIPTAYLEPVVSRLLKKELMAKTAGGLVYTDFIIFRPEDRLRMLDAQIDFVKSYFGEIWAVIEEMNAEIASQPWQAELNERQRQKLGRLALLKVLSDFTREYTGIADDWEEKRKHTEDGDWLAIGRMIPAGYDRTHLDRLWDYDLYGYRSCGRGDVPGAKEFFTFEFDTNLWDNPVRYTISGNSMDYWRFIGRMLFYAMNGKDPTEDGEIPRSMIEAIPGFIEAGILARDGEGRLRPDIAMLRSRDYCALRDDILAKYTEKLGAALGERYRAFLKGTKVSVPPHIDSIPMQLRYQESNHYIPMAAVREAYGRGLHLAGVDWGCPPMIAAYEPEA